MAAICQGFTGVQNLRGSRARAPPGGASSGIFQNDVALVMQVGQPRRVVRGGSASSRGGSASSMTPLERARPPTNSVIFQNDLQMQGRPPVQPAAQHQVMQPWNAEPNRTSDRAVVSRGGSARAAAPWQAAEARSGSGRAGSGRRVVRGNDGLGGMLRLDGPSPVAAALRKVSPTPFGTAHNAERRAAPPPSTEQTPYHEHTPAAQDREAFLAERAERLKQARALRQRQATAPVPHGVVHGESLSALLSRATAEEPDAPVRQPGKQVPATATPFAGENGAASRQIKSAGGKRARPEKKLARGAPSCASRDRKAGTKKKAAAPKKQADLGASRREAAAASRASAKKRAAREAQKVAGAAGLSHKRNALRKDAGRTSSKVLAPPGGRSSIRF